MSPHAVRGGRAPGHLAHKGRNPCGAPWAAPAAPPRRTASDKPPFLSSPAISAVCLPSAPARSHGVSAASPPAGSLGGDGAPQGRFCSRRCPTAAAPAPGSPCPTPPHVRAEPVLLPHAESRNSVRHALACPVTSESKTDRDADIRPGGGGL